MRMRRAIYLGGVLAVVAAGAMTAAPARADEWSKTYQINTRADLQVTTDDGDVTITSADQKQIDAHVTTVGWKIGPGDVRIEESQNGDHVTVSVKLPHMNWHIFGSNHRSLRVELRVPRELDLDVHTGDGNVAMQPVAGRIHVDTGDGNVSASGLRGDIRMHSGDGHIEGTNFDGSLDVNTGDGRINVRGRFDTLNLKTGDGSIEAEAANGSKIASSWTLHSGDGHINLRLPADFHADLDAHTGDGHITLDIPVSVNGSLSRSSIHGKLNGGGGALNLSSGDGSIHVDKLL
jgi:DUF4097 and DUF4098 domain-containing protein YvlB